MAQQRMFVALCLMGVVAYASAQGFNFDLCRDSVRAAAESYTQTLRTAAQEFTSNIQNSGSQAIDTSSFQSDVEKLMQSINQLADFSQGFQASRFMSTYLENMRIVGSLMGSSMRLSLVQGTMREYIAFGNKIYNANNNFLETITSNCLTSGQRILLPASA